MVPRENKSNAYAKFWRDKEYYSIFESGLLGEPRVMHRSRMQRRLKNSQNKVWEHHQNLDKTRPQSYLVSSMFMKSPANFGWKLNNTLSIR